MGFYSPNPPAPSSAILGALAAGKAAKANSEETPVARLYAKYRAFCDASQPEHDRAASIRATLVSRWGNTGYDRYAEALWGHDPYYALLGPANRLSDKLNCEELLLADEVLATPAVTVADMHLKLRIIAADQPAKLALDDHEQYEIDTFNFLKEAVELLDRGVA